MDIRIEPRVRHSRLAFVGELRLLYGRLPELPPPFLTVLVIVILVLVAALLPVGTNVFFQGVVLFKLVGGLMASGSGAVGSRSASRPAALDFFVGTRTGFAAAEESRHGGSLEEMFTGVRLLGH